MSKHTRTKTLRKLRSLRFLSTYRMRAQEYISENDAFYHRLTAWQVNLEIRNREVRRNHK